MMAAASLKSNEGKLPSVRGRLIENAPLSGLTWFRTGGPADFLFRPADEADLKVFLEGLPSGIDITVIGLGSNLLVRDAGIRGVVIKLGKPFGKIETKGSQLTAGAGTSCVTLAHRAMEAGLAGLEFFRGIPGTLGGAVAMNAGAYGSETADVLSSVRCLDHSGREIHIAASEIDFGYRWTSLSPDLLVVGAVLGGSPASSDQISQNMSKIVEAREESQPLRTRTGGSTFKNPGANQVTGRKAWQLIEEAGCRGLTVGGAQVSEKHCNFLINTGLATSEDIESLGEEVRRRVRETTGVELEWEIRRLGERKV
jgi:UDP-N-acetylmuramate dehydrogenase